MVNQGYSEMPFVLQILMALLLLVALFPVFLIVAMLLKCSSTQPVFFKQSRVGQWGRPFIMYKFRTMDNLDLATSSRFDAGDTSRVTRLGAILRKTKLDELPQLVNVIKGDMALVGPRPEVDKWVKVYPERWANVLSVKPGITDPAAIEYRNEERTLAESADPESMYREVILPRKLTIYEEYLQNRTLLSDIIILLKTAVAVVRG